MTSGYELNPQLLHSVAEDGRYGATLRAHGLYNSFQFVLRLSPEVHRRLAGTPLGITSAGRAGFDRAQAFSTYLHETIHWWQHVGSTYGLMASLSYPAQAHANYNKLKQLLAESGFKKPIRNQMEQMSGPSIPDTPRGLANIILNNHFDFSAYRRLTYDLDAARSVAQDPMFESVGHALYMTIANNVLILGATADPEHRVVPHPRHWERPFAALRESKVDGYYYGSPVALWPIGAREILEGQACFGQLQYLHFASGGNLDWAEFRSLGMLHGVYTKAFEEFLRCIRLDHPPSIDHPTVALFLLICDMSINPGSGFPFSPWPHFNSFINDTMPGIRFSTLSTMVRLKCPHVAMSIRDYSRDEYRTVTEELAGILLTESPLKIAATCAAWADGPMASLMGEHRTFDFGMGNTVVRVLFSHFLAFMRDKLETPEFFCWPGAWMAGDRVSGKAQELFERHAALFVDREDDDGIFPRLIPNVDQKLVQRTFDVFYGANFTYNMTNQWITQEGPFVYDYSWLKPSAKPAEFKSFADRQFRMVYGIEPDGVLLV